MRAQARSVGARHAAVVRAGAGEVIEVLGASEPLDSGPPPWLGPAHDAVRACFRQGHAASMSLDSGARILAVPLSSAVDALPSAGLLQNSVGVYLLDSDEPLVALRDRLLASMPLLGIVDLRIELSSHARTAAAMRSAIEVVADSARHRRIVPALNELIARIAGVLEARRVSLGLVRAGWCRCRVMTGLEVPAGGGASPLVRAAEAAMDEAVDQGRDTWWPHSGQENFIARCAQELAGLNGHEPGAVAALPMRLSTQRDPVGAVVVERAIERPWTPDELAWTRLVIDLAAPRLVQLAESDRWAGARLWAWATPRAASLLGPRHTGAKLTALAAAALLLVAAVVPVDLTAAGSFEVASTSRRIVAAPFDGRIESVDARPGQRVVIGESVLARLDVTELSLQLAAARSELAVALKQADAARAASNPAMSDVQVALAQADQARARIELIQAQIGESTLLAPIDGVVVQGEPDRLTGAPVKAGDVLFELADPAKVEALIAVPERQSAGLAVGQAGEIAAAGFPERRLKVRIERIEPAVGMAGLSSVVRVHAALVDQPPPWLRAGMQGSARIVTGRGSLLWSWLRAPVGWARQRLWL